MKQTKTLGMKHFQTAEAAERAFRRRVVPTLVTDFGLYALDRHHHLVALDLSESAYWREVMVSVYIACDFRNLPATRLVARMREHSFLYAFHRASWTTLPVNIDDGVSTLDGLPKNWARESFYDDPWRSLAGFAAHYKGAYENPCPAVDGKANTECHRCFRKPCANVAPGATPFIEFQWGYFFNDVARNHRAWLSDKHRRAMDEFVNGTHAMALSEWEALSTLLVPLCHSKHARSYKQVPIALSRDGRLSGFGKDPLEHDENCPSVACRALIIVA
eukprot:GEMP01059334.1.p1 GENE.GEMP01059334.1~~GEMP01059334.1.p1  ORF type:complete len:275 (+),score=57.78 GEMP01059334.1:200-1024(+)